jgi:hypothetical protein
MRRTILLAALLVLIPSLTNAAGKNKSQSILSSVEVATGAPVTVTKGNANHREGYLVILTENETTPASLVVTVFNAHPSGDILVCTVAAITTDSVWVVYLGPTLTPADGIDANCIWPMSNLVKYTFTVTGTDADFDVTADMLWLTD